MESFEEAVRRISVEVVERAGAMMLTNLMKERTMNMRPDNDPGLLESGWFTEESSRLAGDGLDVEDRCMQYLASIAISLKRIADATEGLGDLNGSVHQLSLLTQTIGCTEDGRRFIRTYGASDDYHRD